MAEIKSVPQHTVYLVFVGLAVILLLMGFIFSPSVEALVEGYKVILTHPSLLDFDGLQQVGHFGSAFVNSGVLLLIVLIVYRLTHTDIQGGHITAAMLMLGFSFYGKNILNIWFPIIGVFLVTILEKKPLESVTVIAFSSTALSPVFSVLAFGTEALVPGSPQAFFVGGVFGILSGALVILLVEHLHILHNGYVLYNVGFAAGIVGMLVNAMIKALNIGHDPIPYVSLEVAAAAGIRADFTSGSNGVLVLALSICFVYLIVSGFLLGGGSSFRDLFWHKSKGGNYVEQFGIGDSLINMGVMGFCTTLYVFLTVYGQLSGPVFACIWTAVGFAACGVTLRTHLPVLLGVSITAFLTGGIAGAVSGGVFLEAALVKLSSRPMILAAIFSCGLAPAVGGFGVLAGLFVGAIHCVLVPNITILHGWMSLYNNAYSLSLIATFLFPIYSRIGKTEAEAGAEVEVEAEAESETKMEEETEAEAVG